MVFSRTKEVIVEDLVSGIIGIFDHKELATDNEFRIIIYYKPATPFGFFSKPRKLPASVPKEGIIEVPASACEDGHARMVIFTYGDDTIRTPVISGMIKQRVGEMVKNLEMMKLQMEHKSEAIATEKRLFERNKDEEIKKAIERKSMEPEKKRSRSHFLDISDEEF